MKKITCKEFFATLFGGIWQAVLWVVGIFTCKDDSRFGKVVKRTLALCVTILVVLFTGFVVAVAATELRNTNRLRPYMDECYRSDVYLSNHIVHQKMFGTQSGRIYDECNRKVLHRKIDWVATSDDKDSLAVFARKGRRGYINRFTGKIVIPERYNRAWVFSEGLAAVEQDGELLFIDHAGHVVIDRDFEVHFDEPRYAFRNGYCMLKNPVTGKMGLIDRNGDWVLEAEYDNVFNNDGFWQVEKDNKVGLYTSDMKEMFPIENTGINVYNGIIEVRHADHIARRYDSEGNLLVDFVIDEVSTLLYETMELHKVMDSDDMEYADQIVCGVAECLRYMVRSGDCSYNDYYGLLSRSGKIVTPPVYTSIEAIGKGLYLCQPDGVIIDNSGTIVK